MEQTQENYNENQVTSNQHSNLPIINTVLSGLTLVVVIAILIITLMSSMRRPTNLGRAELEGMFPNGERPNFEMNENNAPPSDW